MTDKWYCAGCGIESPGRARSCQCLTSVVILRPNGGVSKSAWKVEEGLMAEIRGALARGYCTNENKGKELDCVLIEAMAVEIEKIIVFPNG